MEGGASRKLCMTCDQQFIGDMSKCPQCTTTLITLKPAQSEENLVGQMIDKYRIESLIGAGGMGVVYQARHEMMDRRVAIKMLKREFAEDDSSVKRFQQEARAASLLNHANIITIYDFGISADHQPYIVMEFLDGKPLVDILKEEGPLDPERCLKIFAQVADALNHAHHHGIVHRDLKPSNIIIVANEVSLEFVKVVDFGLAKLMPWSGKESQHLTKTGEVFGSPIYMSPEQCMGRQLEGRSDIYSMAVTMYEVLTGHPPFKGQNSVQTATQHIQNLPPTFNDIAPGNGIPPALEAVVMQALSKAPHERFQDMGTFKEAFLNTLTPPPPPTVAENLKNSIRGLSLSANKPSPIVPTAAAAAGKPPQGKPNVALIAGAGLLLAAIGGGVWFATSHQGASTSTATGTIYVCDITVKPHRLVLHTETGDLPFVFNANELSALGKDSASKIIGAKVTAAYHSASGQNLLDKVDFNDEYNEDVRTAQTVFMNFIDALSYGETLSMLSPELNKKMSAERIAALFPKDRLKSQSSRSIIANEGGSFDTEDPQARSTSALRVLSAEPGKISLLIDRAQFVNDGKGYNRIDLTNNGKRWLLDSITDASACQWTP